MGEAELRRREAFTVMGIQVLVNPMATDYEAIWRQFELREAEIAPHSPRKVYYGVFFPTDQEGLDDHLAGMAVEGVTEAPEGLVRRTVPAAEEAVFACTMDTIGATWAAAFGEWLPAHGYEYDHPSPCYERYVPGSQGPVAVTIHIPLRRK
jgi:predicted transcriptional regulator YdeE